MIRPIPEVVAEVRNELASRGVRAALACMNRNSSHRFTALFRFEGATLRNLYLIDRDDPTVERCPDMPVLESYCVYVRDTSARFLVDDADADERVEGHPKQPVVKAYCGLPLLTATGELFGTICHFDFEPIPFAAEEVIVLEEVAAYLVAAIEAGDWTPHRRPVTV